MPTNLSPLAPDLEAIHAFAEAAHHDLPQEAIAAGAIYEDVCWRVAFIELPPGVEDLLIALEQAAATRLAAYLGGPRDADHAVAFWEDFGFLVEQMAELLPVGSTTRAGSWEQELVRLRARVASADLPPITRAALQPTLDALARAERRHAANELSHEEVASLFREGAGVLEAWLTHAATPPAAPSARLHDMARDVLAVAPPPFLRRALLTRMDDLAAAVRDGRPIADEAYAATEVLFERALDFAAALRVAVARRDALRDRTFAAHLDEVTLGSHLQALVALDALLASLEAGRLERDEFEAAFARRADDLERQLAAASAPDPARAEALVQAEALVARVRAGGLPGFMVSAANELGRQLFDALRRWPSDPAGAAHDAEARSTALARTLALGAAIGGQRTWALGRFEALRGRIDFSTIPPLLRGPVEDELARLRSLLDDIDAGRLGSEGFHAAFEARAARIERQLAWSAADPEAGVEAQR